MYAACFVNACETMQQYEHCLSWVTMPVCSAKGFSSFYKCISHDAAEYLIGPLAKYSARYCIGHIDAGHITLDENISKCFEKSKVHSFWYPANSWLLAGYQILCTLLSI